MAPRNGLDVVLDVLPDHVDIVGHLPDDLGTFEPLVLVGLRIQDGKDPECPRGRAGDEAP